MATGFSTRSGPDGYRLNFDTDNLDYYLLMQKIARHCVDGKPAADVVEVRHGRWIPEACESVSKRNRLIEYRVYSCSICGRSNGRVKKKYCPNCGARMGKEADHEVS